MAQRDVQENKTCTHCGRRGRMVRHVHPNGSEAKPFQCLGKACALHEQRPEWTPFEEIDRPTLVGMGQEIFDNARFYHNSRYHVVVREYEPVDADAATLVHLSIRNNDRSTERDWRDFQRIKDELVGPEEEAVELYPATSRLVDTSNQYHLWCVQGVAWPFGFHERLVMDEATASATNPNIKQRPGAGE